MTKGLVEKSFVEKDFFFKKAYQALNITAKLKQTPDDFVVEEQIPLEFSGDGEHCWIVTTWREIRGDLARRGRGRIARGARLRPFPKGRLA